LCWKDNAQFAKIAALKSKPQKQTGGLKLDMDFDEAMRRVSKIKPAKKTAKRRK
jgi:hypothetical protein